MPLQRFFRCARRRKSWGCKDIINHGWLSGWMGLQAKDSQVASRSWERQRDRSILRRDVVMLTSSFWSIETDFRLLTCR